MYLCLFFFLSLNLLSLLRLEKCMYVHIPLNQNICFSEHKPSISQVKIKCFNYKKRDREELNMFELKEFSM